MSKSKIFSIWGWRSQGEKVIPLRMDFERGRGESYTPKNGLRAGKGKQYTRNNGRSPPKTIYRIRGVTKKTMKTTRNQKKSLGADAPKRLGHLKTCGGRKDSGDPGTRTSPLN